jgi:hypothetical protein
MARCSYCYQDGHNRRTCPKLTADLKSHADAQIARGNTDAWAVQQYQSRIVPTGKKLSRQKCGYCGERGHSRRKCEVLQNDMDWFIQHHNEHVAVAHDYIVTSPVGLGSLFQVTRKDYNYNSGTYDVKNILFVLTDFFINQNVNNNGLNIIARLTDPATGNNTTINLRDYVVNQKYAGSSWSPISLLAPAREIVPSDWFSRQTISMADAKAHTFFKRIGRKIDDERDYQFYRIQSWREQATSPNTAEDFNHGERARAELTRFSAAHNRALIFEDFKNGQ